MSDVLKPTIEDVVYEYDAALGRVNRDGYRGSDFREIPNPSIEAIIEVGPPEDLAIVNFWKRAIIAVRHPDRDEIETIEGDRLRAAADQFVVGWQDRVPLFNTAESIIAEGQLTPHMRRWLDFVANNDRRRIYGLVVFQELLGRPL